MLAPHPDDESVGLGATLAAFAGAGIEVHVALLGDGRESQAPMLRDLAPEARGRWRLGEMQRAVRCLDSRIQWHGLAGSEDPDALNALFRRVAPTLLFAPPPFDFHPDHRAAALPRHATTMWYHEDHAPFGPFEPTVHVAPDKDSLQRKAAALGAHASQVHLFDAVGRLGRLRAVLCGSGGPVEAFVAYEALMVGTQTTRGLTNRPHTDWAVLLRRSRSRRKAEPDA